jgi:MYXO-CTERM domain-containing protein
MFGDSEHIHLPSQALFICARMSGNPRVKTRRGPLQRSSGTQNEWCTMASYRKIVQTGIIMSGLLLTGSAALPANAQTIDQGTTTDRDDRGFDDWGLLGLLGLAGLLGRKRDRDVVRTNRV